LGGITVSELVRYASLILLVFMSIYVAAQDAPDGQAVFKKKCVMCHGVDGKANTDMGRQLNALSLLSDEVRKLSPDEMKQVVTDGKGSMPSFTDQLSPDEITAVVGYVRTLQKNAK
jgi:mono/diheme cytochrome c family protein